MPDHDTKQRATDKPAVAVGSVMLATSKVCIFSHYDPDDALEQYVLEYLHEIKSCGYAILFVSTIDRISPADRARLEDLGAVIRLRENTGRDFGSWQAGIRMIGSLEDIDWLLLANDSVFGPFFKLSDIADEMQQSDADFWGITDSIQTSWHLQSYFLCFRGRIVRSQLFREFFEKDFSRIDKQQIIAQGEIALSHDLVNAGYKGAAYCPYSELDEGEFKRPTNPMHHYWDKLILNSQCPFLKVGLLRDNPSRIPNVNVFPEILSITTNYDTELISSYLKRFEHPR